MNRLEKKCLVASASLHGLLAGVFVFGSAFILAPKRKVQDQLPIIQIIPLDAKLTDRPVFSGGNPNVQPGPVAPPPPPAPAVQTPPPTVSKVPDPEPPAPKPKPVKPAKPIVETKPVKLSDADLKKLKSEKETAARPKINTNIVRRAVTDLESKKVAADRARAEANARAQLQARVTALNGVVGSLSQTLSKGTVVEMAGPGGEAFINYGQFVKSVYDGAWVVAHDVADEDDTTRAQIEINRDGTVAAAKIIRRSGNPALDKSVQRTLDQVRFIAPFPEGATDLRRTFTINFNLKAKRLSG